MNSRPLPYQGSALPLSYASLTIQPYNPTANAAVRVSRGGQKTPARPNKDRGTCPAPSSTRRLPQSTREAAALQPSVRCPQGQNPLRTNRTNQLQPQRLEKNGAQGRVRTSVGHNPADLQSAAINHSATCAWFYPATPSRFFTRTKLRKTSTQSSVLIPMFVRPCLRHRQRRHLSHLARGDTGLQHKTGKERHVVSTIVA